ncbi:MAG: hypothetical protein A2Z14_13720 [Chloroflexi bacterium RBG_16_48_8]|nr:MAG: hypothetical protein A2Z14_13720 [Chloroflexi bacterium RBG_16_48_8]
MKTKNEITFKAQLIGLLMIFCLLAILVVIDQNQSQNQAQAAASFRFISWADTKSDTDILSALSDQAVTLNPAFTIYEGDLEDSGFTSSGMAKWKEAMDGQLTGASSPNGMFDIVFPVRGNHDGSNTSGWQAYFEFSDTANRVGATNYTNMPGQEDLTYSFEYGNSIFIGVDGPGDANKITSAQINWIDGQLSDAESRGLVHAFIYFHGPIYCVDGHCSCSERVCSLDSSVESLITMLNKHTIISATFHGHEHTYAYTYVDETRVPAESAFEGVTHPWHQFVTGDAGAGPKSCTSARVDFCMAKHGFVTVDVSGPDVTVSFYEMGNNNPLKVVSYSQGGGPGPTPTPRPTSTSKPTPTSTKPPDTTFIDVPRTHWAYDYIESLYQGGYVAGCSAETPMYCPENGMTRAEGSVFVERGIWGVGYMPQQCSSQIFTDVPILEWFCKWATGLWNDGYTTGCGTNPLIFCPLKEHTRAEATVFFMRIRRGPSYLPPEPGDIPYADVDRSIWYAKWVVAAHSEGIVQGCEDPSNQGDDRFRPEETLTRAEAACMMDKVKSGPGPTPTPPHPTVTPGPTVPPPTPSPGGGIWISREEVAALPMSGAAWDNVKSEADSSAGVPDLSNQDQRNNVTVMAKALVFARTGDEKYRAEVRQQLEIAIGTEAGGRTLAFGRELVAYIIAADLIDLPNYDPTFDNNKFRPWLREALTEELDGRTLQSTHEDRPNNWGTHAGASRAAIAVYLGDQAELERTAQVFKGWLGDRSTYAGFTYGSLSWQCDPSKPVGINPKGCTRDGHSIDGVQPDDQRRGGDFTWPPPKENYVWEALQGALAQAVILYNAGYDVWNWEDQALLRAVQWLHMQADYPASGDDTWQPHIVNYYYGTNFPAPIPSSPGKNVGWTDWTHGAR